MRERARAFGEAADRAFDLGRFGDDIVGGARRDAAHRQYHGIEGFDAARDHRMQRHHDLAGHRNGIDGVVRHGSMTALAFYRHHEAVGGGEQWANAARYQAARHIWRDMQRESGVWQRIDDAVFQHEARTVIALLARL